MPYGERPREPDLIRKQEYVMDLATFAVPALIAGAGTGTAALVLRWLFARARAEYDMPEQDKAIWRTAASLADVAALTARWLAGELRGQPGYCGPVDVDEQDAPGMTDVLISCNRAGFLTGSSQAGHDGAGYDGAHWQQFAAVDALISPADLPLLHAAVAGTGIVVDASGDGQPVTFRQGHSITWFGRRRKRTDLADDWTGYGICSPTAIAELLQACPVVVYDPEPGRDDRLWPALAHFAEQLQRSTGRTGRGPSVEG
jgi:hypothetical protein